MLCTSRHVFDSKTLTPICYATLNSIYVILLVFGHKAVIYLKVFICCRKKRSECFLHGRNSLTGPLFTVNIRKSFDKSDLENWIFVCQWLKGLLLSVFSSWFKFTFEYEQILNKYDINMIWTNLFYFQIPFQRTKTDDTQ